MLKLEINAHTVMKSIIKNSKVKLTSSDVRINNATSLAVSCFRRLESSVVMTMRILYHRFYYLEAVNFQELEPALKNISK